MFKKHRIPTRYSASFPFPSRAFTIIKNQRATHGNPNKASGELSLHDGDVHENGNKAISLDWQNNNSARASSFFLNISLPSLNDYGVKIRNFKFCGGREDKTMTFFS